MKPTMTVISSRPVNAALADDTLDVLVRYRRATG